MRGERDVRAWLRDGVEVEASTLCMHVQGGTPEAASLSAKAIFRSFSASILAIAVAARASLSASSCAIASLRAFAFFSASLVTAGGIGVSKKLDKSTSTPASSVVPAGKIVPAGNGDSRDDAASCREGILAAT
jgi:hypothetical protein